MNKDIDNAIESLATGLMTYVDTKIDSAPYVKIDIGVVKATPTLSGGKYLHTVEVRKQQYTGIKSLGNNEFPINSIVYILIPNGQYNNMFILGHLDNTNANIKGGTINIGNGNFVVDEDGDVIIKKGHIEGDIEVDLTDYVKYVDLVDITTSDIDDMFDEVFGS